MKSHLQELIFLILAKHRVQDALLAAMALFCAAALTLSAAGSLLPAALDALPTGTVGPLVLWENIPDYDDYALISHGVGALNGRTRVAARESFLYNYRLGYRVFECDFVLTSDGYAVLRHDWLGGMQEGVDEDHIPTKAEFSQIPILDQYTPLTFEDLMELMVRFPDVWIVTDFKDTDDDSVTALFTALVEEAQALGRPDLLRRMVVQLYTPEMYHTVEAVHHFQHYMLTLYQTEFYGEADILERYVSEAAALGIYDIVMWSFLYDESFLPILEKYGSRVYVHSLSDPAAAQDLLDRGVYGIYADGIDPAAVRR